MMDRSRREVRREPPGDARRDSRREAGVPRAETAPPASSRLILRRARNRRRPGSLWSRLPRPGAIADACGRAARRSLPAAAAVAALAILAGGLWTGHRWITHSPRFAIEDIAVHGAHRVDPGQLRAALPIHAGDSVFAGLSGVADAARESPWVASVDVHRMLPHTIVIELREHIPAALVDLGELYLVDATGHPFKRAALEDGDGDRDGAPLPIITGIDRAAFTTDPAAAAAWVCDALAAADRWRAGDRPAVREIHVDPHGALTLHAHAPAIAIQLGAPGAALDGRLRMFDTAWAALAPAERARARAIHLDTRPDHATVAFAKD
jgi:cell division protein FtsQ